MLFFKFEYSFHTSLTLTPTALKDFPQFYPIQLTFPIGLLELIFLSGANHKLGTTLCEIFLILPLQCLSQRISVFNDKPSVFFFNNPWDFFLIHSAATKKFLSDFLKFVTFFQPSLTLTCCGLQISQALFKAYLTNINSDCEVKLGFTFTNDYW